MKKLLVLGALIVATTNAWALSYTVGNGSTVDLNTSDPGLVLNYSLNSTLSGKTFSLNDGQSKTFSFFSIWTNEGSVNADDKVAKAITATLDFLSPDINAIVGGTTVGTTSISGFYQSGVLTGAAPVTLTAAGTTFVVSLSNVVFNSGAWWGLDEGYCDGAVVKATVTQRSTAVPDGGMTLTLLGATILGLVFVRRKVA